jgi:hypothetical protein
MQRTCTSVPKYASLLVLELNAKVRVLSSESIPVLRTFALIKAF